MLNLIKIVQTDPLSFCNFETYSSYYTREKKKTP